MSLSRSSTVLIFLCWALPAFMNAQWSIDGYVVTFPTMIHQQPELARLLGGDESVFAELTRLRIRPSMEFSEVTFFRLEYEIGASYVSSPAGQFGSGTVRGQIADLTWKPDVGGRWTFPHGIDRFFVKTMAGPIDLVVGRQRIAWGVGRVWNPTDLFNPINPADFSKVEKDGVDAVHMTARIGDLSDLSAVWNPQRHGRSSGAVRARTNWEGIDGAVMAGRYEDRWVLGGDLTGAILDAGVRAEGIVIIPPSGLPLTRFVVGLDNQFTSQWYAMIEFLFNGEGRADPPQYELGRLLAGQILQLARRYAIVQTSYLLHPLVTAQASMLRNVDDGSGFAGVSVACSLTDEASMAVGGQFTFGRRQSEYWYYPRNYYLRADLFF